MSNAKLKPCPRCGGRVYVQLRNLVSGYFVYCDNMRCDWVVATDSYKTRQEAADAWNAGNVTITPIRTK